MRVLVVIPVLLFASLLLVAGCGGGGGSSTGNAPGLTTSAGTTPATGDTQGGTNGGETNNQGTTGAGSQDATLTIINSAGERVPVRVEIESTEAQREKGLMDRTSLAEDAGAFFVFDGEQSSAFWMKDTLIPLSIAFIDSGGRIVDIQDMQPLDETSHYPATPYRYALEVNQGFFADHSIEVGDMLERQS